jgi:DNA-binding MarR family transcriptional regulator
MNKTVPAGALAASAPLPGDSASGVTRREALPVPRTDDPAVGAGYRETLHLIERLHRCLLDLIKDEFDRRGVLELTSTQGLLLFNIGGQELSATELRSRGYYLGSNVSYNVKKLVEAGYLHHARSSLDRRAVRISLTPRGREVHGIVQALYQRHARSIAPVGGLAASDFEQVNESLARLERFWRDQIRYRL